MKVLIFNIPYNVGKDAKVLFIIPKKNENKPLEKMGTNQEHNKKKRKKGKIKTKIRKKSLQE